MENNESSHEKNIQISELDSEFENHNLQAFEEIEKSLNPSESIKISDFAEAEAEAEETETTETSESENLSEHLTGKIAVNLFDVIMSRLFAFGSNRAGFKADYKDFKLDANEKKSLEVPLDAVLKKHGFSQLAPEYQLIIIIVSIYGAKFALMTEKSSERKNKNVPRGTQEAEIQEVDYLKQPAPYGRFSNGKPKKAPKK